MHPLISVIVPIYNVELYIHKCVDSILAQSYANLEIILVNDGSTDGCSKICDEYAANNPRIMVLHKENGGLSDARNAGLNIASGEYIGFVDGDDFIEENIYEKMLNVLEEYTANLAICSYFSDIEIKYPCEKSMLADTDYVFKLYLKNRIQAYAWNKLYSKKIFSEIRYTKGILFEDMDIFLPIIKKAERIVLLNDKLYHYIQRENSITNSKFNPRQTKCLDIIESYKEYSKEMGGIYDCFIKEYSIFLNWWLLCKTGETKNEYDVYINGFVKTIRDFKPHFPVTCKADFLLLRMLAYGFNVKFILLLRRWYIIMKSKAC